MLVQNQNTTHCRLAEQTCARNVVWYLHHPKFPSNRGSDVTVFGINFDVLRYFTWDKHTFPNPIAMQENLAASGRKLVTIVDPHIKRDPGYYIYKEAQDKGLYVMNKDRNEFDG